MEITLSTTVGTRSVRCRNNSLNPAHTTHRHRGNSRNSTPRSHQSQSPIYTTVAREHHHLHDAPVRTSVRSHHHLGMLFLLHAGPSIYRAPGYPDLSAVLPPCVASLAEREESVEAFSSFLCDYFSSSSSFLQAPSCVSPYGMVVNALTSAPSSSSSPSTCVALQTLLLLGVSTFLSKIPPPGPGLLSRDSTRRVPCLFNVSPVRRRHTEFFHRNLSPRLLSCPPRVA